ncbi:MAG: acyl-CoA dehydrogenase family protein [Dehalococcoidia bacterium]
MDFRFTPEQEAFRAEVRCFIDETLTPEFWSFQRGRREPGWSPEFSRAAAARGWLGIAWPREYGGQARGIIEQMIYMEEMARARAPQEHHRRAVQQVGPSIMLFGSEEQKAEYLPAISRAEISFAMGLSEVAAGSDLANVQTLAVRDGDEYVLSGSKRYTSGAHFSDYLWTVARTDPNAPKHRGISIVIVPLNTRGIEVRSLIDLQGRHHFNEVFLQEVRVPVSNRVGEENRGWYVNAATMDFERSGIARIAALRRLLERCVASLLQAPDALRSGPIYTLARARLAEYAVAVEVATLLAYRVAWLQSEGRVPNYEVSITKVLASETSQQLYNFIVNFQGLPGLLRGDDDRGGGDEEIDARWGPGYLAAASATIAQGTSEVNRSVIATRGLGLPRA